MNKRHLNRLISEIAAGNTAAVEKLYVETKNGVYAFVYPFFKNSADTDDCVETVYLKVMERASSFRANERDANGAAWLLQIAKHTALEELRRKKRFMCTFEQPQSIVEPQDRTVWNAMNSALDGDEREIAVLHLLWGYKHKEIASIKSMPLGTVTSKYKRSLEKIKKFMEEKCESKTD